MDIKKRTFDFDQKESYTKLEVDAILSQHSKFVEGASRKELESFTTKISELETSNKEYAQAERSRAIKKVAKEVSPENFEKLIKYAKIADDADEATIKSTLLDISKDFSPVVDTKKPVVVEKTIKEVSQPKPKKQYRFMK